MRAEASGSGFRPANVEALLRENQVRFVRCQPFEKFDDDRFTQNGYWVELKDHLADVEREAKAIVETLPLGDAFKQSVIIAARHHDIGKSLQQWQTALPRPLPDEACSPGGGSVASLS